MAAATDDKSLTLNWKIENFSSCLGLVPYHSPEISSRVRVANWKLLIKRMEYNSFSFSIVQISKVSSRLELGLFLMSYEGSVLAGGRVGITNPSRFVTYPKHFEWKCGEIFGPRRDEFLPEDILTIRCNIWERGKDFRVSETVSIRSSFGKESLSFVWVFPNFSSQQRYKIRDLQLRGNVKPLICVSFKAFINKNDSFVVGVKPLYSYILPSSSSLEVSVMDVNHEAVETWKDKAQVLTKFELRVEIPSLRQRLMRDGGRCLPQDVLSLKCDLAYEGVFNHEHLVYENISIRNMKRSFNQSKPPSQKKMKYNSPGDTSWDQVSNYFKTMLEDNVFSDFTIQTLSKSFHVHRAVLGARSPVFYAMLTGDMKEAHGEPMQVPEVDEETMQVFLTFLYTGEFMESLHWEEAIKLYSVADIYQVLGLREKCSGLLKSELSAESACDVAVLAYLHPDDEVLNLAVKEYIASHGKTILSSERWEKFASENLKLSLKIIREMFLRR